MYIAHGVTISKCVCMWLNGMALKVLGIDTEYCTFVKVANLSLELNFVC